MKLMLCVFITALTLQVVLSAQTTEHRPVWLSERVTIRETRLPEFLDSIQRVGGFTLEIKAEDKELLLPHLMMSFSNASMEDVLQFTFGTVGLGFNIVDDKTVQVFKKALP